MLGRFCRSRLSSAFRSAGMALEPLGVRRGVVLAAPAELLGCRWLVAFEGVGVQLNFHVFLIHSLNFAPGACGLDVHKQGYGELRRSNFELPFHYSTYVRHKVFGHLEQHRVMNRE